MARKNKRLFTIPEAVRGIPEIANHSTLAPESTDPDVVLSFFSTVSYRLDHEQQSVTRKALNLHHLGDIDCNTKDADGKLISKHPEKETHEFKQSHHVLARTREVRVILDVHTDGTVTMRLVD